MSEVAIINGTFVDVVSKSCEKRNLLLRYGKLSGIGYIPDEDEDALTIIDITGKTIVPSVIDLGGYSVTEFSPVHQSVLRSGITASTVCLSVSDVSTASDDGGPEWLKGVSLFTEKGDLNELSIAKQEGSLFVSYHVHTQTVSTLSESLPFLELLQQTLCIDLRCSSDTYGALCKLYQCEGLHLEETLVSFILQQVEGSSVPVHFMGLTSANSVDLVAEHNGKVTCSVSPLVCVGALDEGTGGSDSGLCHYSLTQDERDQLKNQVVSGKVDVLSSAMGLMMPSRMDYACVSLLLPLLYQVFVSELTMPLESVFKLVTTRPYDILRVKPPRLGLGASPNFTILETKAPRPVAEVLDAGMVASMGELLPINCVGYPYDVYYNGKSVQLTS